MRLRIIAEDITRSDFFDFYALLYAYQDRSHYNHDQIAAELRFVVDYITKDHLNQFADMLLNRVPDPDHEETAAAMAQYGVSGDEETYLSVGMEKLSLQEKAQLLRQVLSFDHEHGFTGQTWFGLARTFLELVRAPQGLDSQILVVDKIYNLLHHGGQITDYMDENDWIEDALNYRDNANPAQIFAKASSRVRSVIGRASYSGMDRSPVGDIPKIYTALRRVAGRREGIEIQAGDRRIDITVRFRDIFANYEGNKTRMGPAWGGKMSDQLAGRPDLFELGDWHTGQISIEDRGDVLVVMGGGIEIPVPKPVNRQFNLAHDLVDAAQGIGSGSKLGRGAGIGRIKDSYNYVDGRRVKNPAKMMADMI